MTSNALYLDLLKRCLVDSIFADDPLANFVFYQEKASTPAWKRRAVRAMQSFLSRYRLRLVEPYGIPWIGDYTKLTSKQHQENRERGQYWPVRAHTMIGLKRLNNIQACVETILRDGVPGDLIETGVWRGGACIFMKGILRAYGDEVRAVWLADSFEGLPVAEVDRYGADKGDVHSTFNPWLAVSRADVEENFRRYGLLDDRVKFLEGWFENTLPNAPIGKLALLRLDGDMYSSTIQALDALYHKLSPGGFLIVDDYNLPNCAKAITDFRATHRIEDPIQEIDGLGVFWRKSQP